MKALPVVVVVLLGWAAACGGSTVSVQDSAPDGGGTSSGTNDGTCAATKAPDCAVGDCLDGPSLSCVRGVWICPTPQSNCTAQCSGKTIPDCGCGTAKCHYGQWQCAASADCVADDGGSDAGWDGATGADASATFPCGGLLVCHAASEYCKIGVGGPAGAQPSYQCVPVPAACASNVTCTCIKPASGGQLCSDAPGVTVTFEYP